MRPQPGERLGASCPFCDALIEPDSPSGVCDRGCEDLVTTVKRESITYVYVHDSAASPHRRVVNGRPIAD